MWSLTSGTKKSLSTVTREQGHERGDFMAYINVEILLTLKKAGK